MSRGLSRTRSYGVRRDPVRWCSASAAPSRGAVLVEGGAEGVDVEPGIGVALAGFGREVVGGADRVAELRLVARLRGRGKAGVLSRPAPAALRRGRGCGGACVAAAAAIAWQHVRRGEPVRGNTRPCATTSLSAGSLGLGSLPHVRMNE